MRKTPEINLSEIHQDILKLILTFLSPSEALNLALTSKFHHELFHKFYKSFSLGPSFIDTNLSNEALRKALYTKIRLPFKVNYEEFQKISDVECKLHSISNTEEAKNSVAELAENFAMKDTASTVWHDYYRSLLTISDNHILTIKAIQNLYLKLKSEKYTTNEIKKLFINYLTIQKKLRGVDASSILQFTLHHLADSNNTNYEENYKKFFLDFFSDQTNKKNNNHLHELMFKSGLETQYILEIITYHFKNVLENAWNEQDFYLLCQWFLQFSKLLNANPSFVTKMEKKLLENPKINNLKKIISLHDKSLAEIALFLCKLFGTEYTITIQRDLRHYFKISPAHDLALNGLHFFYKSLKPENEIARNIRIEIGSVYLSKVKNDIQEIEFIHKKRPSKKTINENSAKISTLWKTAEDWYQTQSIFEPSYFFNLGKLYQLTIGLEVHKIYISSLKDKNENIEQIAIDFYGKALSFPLSSLQKKDAIAEIAQLSFQQELKSNNVQHEKSIAWNYALNKISKYGQEQICPAASLHDCIKIISKILFLLEDPNKKTNVLEQLKVLMSYPAGKNLIENFSKTDLAKGTGFDILVASNKQIGLFQTCIGDLQQKILEQRTLLTALEENLTRLQKLPAQIQTQHLSQLQEVNEMVKQTNLHLENSTNRIKEIPTPQVSISNINSSSFFGPPSSANRQETLTIQSEIEHKDKKQRLEPA